MPKRIDLAKIHIAKKELGLDDTTYRGILRARYHRESAAELNDSQTADLIELFREKGWRPASARQRGLILMLWHQLETTGAIRRPGVPALVSFVEHATGKNDLRRLSVREASRVIEILKQWRQRTASGEHRH